MSIPKCDVFMHSNGFSTERNMVVEMMRVCGLDEHDFRLRDKLIVAASPWLDIERGARNEPVGLPLGESST